MTERDQLAGNIIVAIAASMPIRHRGVLASRATIRPPETFSRKTIAPFSSRPIKMQRILTCIDADHAGNRATIASILLSIAVRSSYS